MDRFAGAVALDWLFLIVVAPFIGSFLGVLATRIQVKRSIVFGRSACPKCGHRLGWRDLVPVLSWIVQRRRCRYCKASIDAFYPAIEIGAVLVALSAAWQFSGWLLWVSCAFGWILLLLAAIDYLWMVLPDELTLPLIPAGLAVAYLAGSENITSYLAGAVAGFVAFAGLAWLYRRLRGREGLGMGDAKLLAVSGSWVSIVGLPSVVLLAATSALLAVLIATLAGRILRADDKVPFGSYLCFGTWLVWLLGPLG